MKLNKIPIVSYNPEEPTNLNTYTITKEQFKEIYPDNNFNIAMNSLSDYTITGTLNCKYVNNKLVKYDN
jgi:hypothetical protein